MAQENTAKGSLPNRRQRIGPTWEADTQTGETFGDQQMMSAVAEYARALTGARYGVLALLDEDGQVEDMVSSGLTAEQTRELRETPEAGYFYRWLGEHAAAQRSPDFASVLTALNVPDFPLPLAADGPLAALATPIRDRDALVGGFLLCRTAGGDEFNSQDEEALIRFAALAGAVIVNARRYRDERRARAELEALVDTVPLAVTMFNGRTGELLHANLEANRLVRQLQAPNESAERLLSVLKFHRADGREFSLEELSLADLLQYGETLRAEEIVIEAPHGRFVKALVNATPILSDAGVVESYVITLQDLSALEDLERLRARLLGEVSREMWGPLASIKGAARTLLEAAPSLDANATEQFLRVIDERAEFLRQLISQLLDVSRIEAGTLSVRPAPTDLAVVVEEAKRTYLSTGGSREVTLMLDPSLPRVMADPPRIMQLMHYLLAQSDDGSPLSLRAVSSGTHVEVSLTDSGWKGPAERQPDWPSQFSMTEQRRLSDRGGSQLGLAICKGIVEAHGGRIWDNEQGPGGARLVFTLPIAERPAEGSFAAGAGRSRNGSPPSRILVVDADPLSLNYVRSALLNAEFDARLCANPAEALQLAADLHPDLILLELVLPGADGIDVMQSLFDVCDAPIIFCSTYGRAEVMARALQAGAADYLIKPFSTSELVARIEAVLSVHSAVSVHEPAFVLDDLTINYGERSVLVDGHDVQLSATEFNLLAELSRHPGRVLRFDQLERRVWGSASAQSVGKVRTTVMRLRRKLGDPADRPRYISAVPRVGYRMALDDHSETSSPG